MWDTYRALILWWQYSSLNAAFIWLSRWLPRLNRGMDANLSGLVKLHGSNDRDHVSSMISDAYIKGIKDFDLESAYSYMRKNAFNHPGFWWIQDGKGRRALTSYLNYGYIPLEDSVWMRFIKENRYQNTRVCIRWLCNCPGCQGNGEDRWLRYTDKKIPELAQCLWYSNWFRSGQIADGKWIEPFDPNIKQVLLRRNPFPVYLVCASRHSRTNTNYGRRKSFHR